MRNRSAPLTAGVHLPASSFPKLALPLPVPYPVMESRRAERLPHGHHWQFEPKWDGFRCLVFRSGLDVAMQSKAGQSLSRYFPELMAAFLAVPSDSFILDGEIAVFHDGTLSFDSLLLRIHPAKSRIASLAQDTPATFIAFDILYDPAEGGTLVIDLPLAERRRRLEKFFTHVPEDSPIRITPMTRDRRVATEWFSRLSQFGCDGIIAKKLEERYHGGDREAMMKVKRLKTVDCVVGGYRYAVSKDAATMDIGSLLLGLYDEHGILHHVGHTSTFNRTQRAQLAEVVEPLRGGAGFTGKAPGGPSRWSIRRSDEWQAIDPVLVCEVQYDHFTQGRFRHGSKFLRWRPEKDPKQCTFDQVRTTRKESGAAQAFLWGGE